MTALPLLVYMCTTLTWQCYLPLLVYMCTTLTWQSYLPLPVYMSATIHVYHTHMAVLPTLTCIHVCCTPCVPHSHGSATYPYLYTRLLHTMCTTLTWQCYLPLPLHMSATHLVYHTHMAMLPTLTCIHVSCTPCVPHSHGSATYPYLYTCQLHSMCTTSHGSATYPYLYTCQLHSMCTTLTWQCYLPLPVYMSAALHVYYTHMAVLPTLTCIHVCCTPCVPHSHGSATYPYLYTCLLQSMCTTLTWQCYLPLPVYMSATIHVYYTHMAMLPTLTCIHVCYTPCVLHSHGNATYPYLYTCLLQSMCTTLTWQCYLPLPVYMSATHLVYHTHMAVLPTLTFTHVCYTPCVAHSHGNATYPYLYTCLLHTLCTTLTWQCYLHGNICLLHTMCATLTWQCYLPLPVYMSPALHVYYTHMVMLPTLTCIHVSFTPCVLHSHGNATYPYLYTHHVYHTHMAMLPTLTCIHVSCTPCVLHSHGNATYPYLYTCQLHSMCTTLTWQCYLPLPVYMSATHLVYHTHVTVPPPGGARKGRSEREGR